MIIDLTILHRVEEESSSNSLSLDTMHSIKNEICSNSGLVLHYFFMKISSLPVTKSVIDTCSSYQIDSDIFAQVSHRK